MNELLLRYFTQERSWFLLHPLLDVVLLFFVLIAKNNVLYSRYDALHLFSETLFLTSFFWHLLDLEGASFFLQGHSFLLDQNWLDFLLDNGLSDLFLHLGCLSLFLDDRPSVFLLDDLLVLFVDDRLVLLVNDLLVLLVDNRLVDFPDLFLVDYGLDVLMNLLRVVLVDYVFVVLVNHVLMMLVYDVLVVLLDDGLVHVGLHSHWLDVGLHLGGCHMLLMDRFFLVNDDFRGFFEGFLNHGLVACDDSRFDWFVQLQKAFFLESFVLEKTFFFRKSGFFSKILIKHPLAIKCFNYRKYH